MTCECRTEEKFEPLPERAIIEKVSKFLEKIRYLHEARVTYTQTKPYPDAEFEAVVSYIDDFPEY